MSGPRTVAPLDDLYEVPSDARVLHICASEVERLLHGTLEHDYAVRIAGLIRAIANRLDKGGDTCFEGAYDAEGS